MALREDGANARLQSLWSVLPEVGNDLTLEMNTSRRNANGPSKNTPGRKIGDRRDSDTSSAEGCK